MKSTLTALVGAQYGSEGKGHIAHYLSRDHDICVRVGGPNAGHTFYTGDGKKHVNQSLPVGWARQKLCVIARGAMVSLPQLRHEVEIAEATFGRVNLLIDSQATVVTDGHRAAEGGVHGDMHREIGSTGEGVGAARASRLARDPGLHLTVEKAIAAKVPDALYLDQFVTDDVSSYLSAAMATGNRILLEGTQGSGLSLIHGPWPYVTSADTNAAQLCADAGVAPTHLTEVVLVARTFPIRVAGNSGPMHRELSWDDFPDVEPERTTVTKKVRRIGVWDEALFRKAVTLNGPTRIALTFADYLDAGARQVRNWDRLSLKVKNFVAYVEFISACPVSYIGTGYDTLIVRGHTL